MFDIILLFVVYTTTRCKLFVAIYRGQLAQHHHCVARLRKSVIKMWSDGIPVYVPGGVMANW